MVDLVQLFICSFFPSVDPLLWAAYKGHVHVVRYLVEQGADINIKDDISEQKYTADCKLVLVIRVCFHSPEQMSLLLIEL